MVAGDSRTFEMRIAIPDGVGSGAATLIWQLGDRGPAGPKTTFQISTAPGTPGPDR